MKTLQDRITWAYEEAKKRDPHLTKTKLWKACGISSGAVSLWFNGSTQEIDGKNARVVARILGVDRDWLAFGKGKPAADSSVMVAERPPQEIPSTVTDSDVLALFARMTALQAGLMAIIRAAPVLPNLNAVLGEEVELARDTLAANPVDESALAAFDEQIALLRATVGRHHSSRS